MSRQGWGRIVCQDRRRWPAFRKNELADIDPKILKTLSNALVPLFGFLHSAPSSSQKPQQAEPATQRTVGRTELEAPCASASGPARTAQAGLAFPAVRVAPAPEPRAAGDAVTPSCQAQAPALPIGDQQRGSSRCKPAEPPGRGLLHLLYRQMVMNPLPRPRLVSWEGDAAAARREEAGSNGEEDDSDADNEADPSWKSTVADLP